eukprot:GGOE01001043.1.p1 GENE.GGOE01001043.1~~GGOE01001043.1.p1  ORF type:complete len:211 (+),score=48.21 GGOE01001043.1:536-1168(+)
MPVFASVEEEERFLGRTSLEEVRGNIKKLLRVQEDETKFPTYLEGLRCALCKVDSSPRREGILQQPGVADWISQARKVVETEEKNSHLLPHLLAQLDGWVVTKELQGDGLKPVPPMPVAMPPVIPVPMPLGAVSPLWPPMMFPAYQHCAYQPSMLPGYPPPYPYPYTGMGYAPPAYYSLPAGPPPPLPAGPSPYPTPTPMPPIPFYYSPS